MQPMPLMQLAPWSVMQVQLLQSLPVHSVCSVVSNPGSNVKISENTNRRSRQSRKNLKSVEAIECTLEGLPEDQLTTIIFRNIPHDCTRDALTTVLDSEGFRGLYDFVHVPVNFQDMAGLSYALVNMVNNDIARRVLEHFQGFQITDTNLCSVAWSAPNQGLEAHIERYRNSPMMHESVPSQYKPALFQNGVLVPFPEPTKHLRAPRVRHPKVSKMF
jgi:hypothetical protein